MATSHLEREDKFAVDPAFVMPPIGLLAPGAGGAVEETVALRAIYFDTAEHDLLAHGITLRRREGGSDAGWHLKVPQGKARAEIALPLDESDTPPERLTDLVVGASLGRPLITVAVVRTSRHVQRIVDGNGATVLEAADDTVTAAAGGDEATLSSWREIELELGSGTEALLAKAGRRLRKAGAQRSLDGSKLARALGSHAAAPVAGDADTAAGVLRTYIREQHRALVAGDVALRRGHDPIHPTRVATRRLRSTLRVFEPLLVPSAARELDSELSWYAGLLGRIRDREVQRARFTAALAELPDELVLGPVAASIEQRLLSEQLAAREELMRELSGPRYLALLADVAEWARAPKLAHKSRRGATALEGPASDAQRKAARQLGRALTQDLGDEALHTARKSAKRARYAAEAVAPVIGRAAAKRRIARFTAVQEALGDHQDSLIAADLLRRMGADAGTSPGQNGFTYGLLYARELQAAEAARRLASTLKV